MRLLLDPTATSGGAAAPAADATTGNANVNGGNINGNGNGNGGNAIAAKPGGGNGPAKPQGEPHPDMTKPPAAHNEPPRVQPIWVAPDDWTRTQTELQSLREFQRTAQAEAEHKDAERIKALAEKGQLDEALKQLNTKFETKLRAESLRSQTIETEWLSEKRNSAIEQALTGKTFTGVNPQETAAMVRRLLESEVEAVRDDSTGKPLIRDRVTKRPAGEYLQERLESTAFAVFFAATNRGGSGADGARPAAATSSKNGDPNSAFAAAFLSKLNDSKNARF